MSSGTGTLAFTLIVTMDSDWHVGSGQGRQRRVDALIDRDADGLPYIPASTLRGMLRDGAERLAYGLDNGEERGAWVELVPQLLGSQPAQPEDTPRETDRAPLPSRLELNDARFPDAMRRHLAGKDGATLRAALTFLKPGVSIGRHSGRAKTDFLRNEEVARAGAVLRAKGSLVCPADKRERETVAAFLVGAAALVERLGGKRRRGMGKCTIAFSFHDAASLPGDAKAAAKVLGKAEQKAPVLPTPAAAEGQTLGAAAGAGAGAWIKIPLRLTLRSAVIVPDEVQGNVITSHDHIPGSLLLAHVAGALETAGIADVWPRIAAGDVRVLPATPEIDGQRSLPVPAVWERPKGDSDYKCVRVVPHASEDGADDQGDDAKIQYEPIGGGFVSTGAPAQVLASVPRSLRTHNTVLDEKQRPDESVGGVYSYEVIAAGQVFRTEVWIRGVPCDVAKVRTALADEEARLGRAWKAGYGRVEVAADAALRPLEVAADSRSPGREVTVWLASDMVVAPGAAPGGLALLADAVALAGGLAEGAAAFDLKHSWGSVRWRRIEGWQSQWGLPRPTLVALRAGSVAALRLRDGVAIDAERLAAIEAEGLGERRGEGFGCVVLNHAFLSQPSELVPVPKVHKPKDEAIVDANPAPVGDELRALIAIHRNAWKRCLALRAEHAADTRRSSPKVLAWEPGKPNMSQLGSLRSVMGELSSEEDLSRTRRWWTHLKDVRNRIDKWPEKARDQLGALLADPDKVWPMLGLGLPQDTLEPTLAGAAVPPALQGYDPRGDADLTRFALRALLLQAIRYHKRAIETSGKPTP